MNEYAHPNAHSSLKKTTLNAKHFYKYDDKGVLIEDKWESFPGIVGGKAVFPL